MTSRPHSIILRLFSVLFFLIGAAPLLIKTTGIQWRPVTTLPTYENRSLALFENLSLSDITSFPKIMETWLSDTLPFRKIFMDNYIRIWTRNLLSTHAGYIQGKDGDLFAERKDASFVSAQLGLRPLSDDFLENLRISYSGMQAYCDSHGIKYLLVIIPDKVSTYRDHLPPLLKNTKLPSHYDQLSAALSDTPVNLLLLKPHLLKKNNSSRTYNKYFDLFHWNAMGLDCAYEAICSRLGEPFQKLEKPYDIQWLTQTDAPWKAEQVPFMNITRKEKLTLRNDLIADTHQALNIITQLPWSAPDYVINKEGLPYNMVLLSDSYIKKTHQTDFPGANGNIFPIACHINQYFASHYFTVTNYNHLEVIRQKIKPDFWVEVMAESAAYSYFPRNTDTRIDLLGRRALKELFIDLADMVRNSPLPSSSIQWISKKDLTFLAENDDPIFELPEIVSPKTGKITFVCELNSPGSGFSQLYYAEEKEPFSGEKCLGLTIKEGSNILLFTLKAKPGTKIRLRFDPGNIPGSYQISPLSDQRINQFISGS